MSGSRHRIRLTVKAIATAKPKAKEYTLWDNLLGHFGVRVQPSGVRSFIVQTRAQGRMRKITLGRFPELSLDAARREGAAVLARLWGGEDVAPPRKAKAPLFRDFAARYRERRKHRWKPSSLETYDIYMGNRLMPHFGRLRLDAITPRPRLGLVRRGERGQARCCQPRLRDPARHARRRPEVGRGRRACPRPLRQHREEPAPARRPIPSIVAELERLGAVLDRRREHRSRRSVY